MNNIKICKYYEYPKKCLYDKQCGNQLLSGKTHCCSDLYYSMALEEENKKYKQALDEIGNALKPICESCRKYYYNQHCEDCDTGAIKDIINKAKE